MKISITERKLGKYKIKWYLREMLLWITKEDKYEKYDSIESDIPKLKGSFNWLCSVNDTMLFDEITGEFKVGIIDMEYEMTVSSTKNISCYKYREIEGDINLDKKEYCSFKFPTEVSYDKEKDCLMSLPDIYGENKELILVLITYDFGYFVDKNELCGWILKNASQYVYSESGEYNLKKDVEELLYEYIKATELWEKYEDIRVFDEVCNIVKEREDILSLEIKSCIDNILEFI